jgi:hypothetical protein
MFWTVARDFLVNLAAGAVGELSSPSGMIGYLIGLGVLVYGAIGWHRKRTAEGKRGMDSWYFIALSFVIAGIAIGGGAYGIGLRSAAAPDPNRVSQDTAQIQPSSAAPTGSVLVSSRYYSTKNKEEVAAFLDKISDAINKTGDEILVLAEQALNNSPWDRPGENITPYIKRMDDIAALTIKMHIALYDELLANEREYRVEMNSILFPKDPFIHFQTGVNAFHNGLSVWMNMRDSAGNVERNELLRLVQSSRMSFGEARDKFVAWLSRRQELIGQTRRALRS